MPTTNPTISSSTSQIYNVKSGGSQKTTNVTDVFFADTLNSEYQRTQSAKDSNYDSLVKEKPVSIKEKSTPEPDKTEKQEPVRPEKQDENQSADEVEQTEEQPKAEENSADKTDQDEGKVDEKVKSEDSDKEEETPLDALAGQPEAMTNRQQAMEAISVLQVDVAADNDIDDMDIDIEQEIDAALGSKRQDKTIQTQEESNIGKSDSGIQIQDAGKTDKENELTNKVDGSNTKEVKTDNLVDTEVEVQNDTTEESDFQNELVNLKKDQANTQQVKAEVQVAEVNDETVIETETDESEVDNNTKSKKIDFKDFKHDYSAGQEQMSQNNSGSAGTEDKNASRDHGFDRGDNLSKIAFASSTTEDSKSVQQTLGLDKSSEKMDIDSTKNVDNIVKTVKTMVSNNSSSMVIRLDPPELGEMRISIKSGADGMSIEIQAANAKSQQMLQQSSGQLRSALENSGVNVNNVDVQFKPDMKNDANAGSDFQDDQSNLFDQNSNQNMADSGRNPDDSFQQNFSSWAEGGEFEDADFASAEASGTTQDNSEQWQEISFDAVNVLI